MGMKKIRVTRFVPFLIIGTTLTVELKTPGVRTADQVVVLRSTQEGELVTELLAAKTINSERLKRVRGRRTAAKEKYRLSSIQEETEHQGEIDRENEVQAFYRKCAYVGLVAAGSSLVALAMSSTSFLPIYFD
jgi:hypothetical protein